MAYPKVIWPSGGANTLTFVYPPVEFPIYHMSAVRHDNFAAGGARESVVECVQNFIDLNMQYVVSGGDATAWGNFLTQCAIPGFYFDYYPDSSLTPFTTYRQDGASAKIAYKHPGMFTYKALWRQKQ